MQIEYGFAEILVKGMVYKLSPSLLNISKIGTPKIIIESFQALSYKHIHYVHSYSVACNILRCCGIPDELVGGIIFSQMQKKSLISPGLLPIEEVFILARHCLNHGVCGMIDDDNDTNEGKKAKPMTEFDAHLFIVDAMEILSVSLKEAENMSMTQFGKLASAKLTNSKRREYIEKNGMSKEESEDDLEDVMGWYHDKVAKINEVNEQNKLAENKD